MKNKRKPRAESGGGVAVQRMVVPHVTINKPDLLVISADLTLIGIHAGKVLRQLEESMTAVDALVRRAQEARQQVKQIIEACDRNPLPVSEAQRLRVCRFCKLHDDPSPGNPLVLKYGEEYAHAECLKRPNDKSSNPASTT